MECRKPVMRKPCRKASFKQESVVIGKVQTTVVVHEITQKPELLVSHFYVRVGKEQHQYLPEISVRSRSATLATSSSASPEALRRIAMALAGSIRVNAFMAAILSIPEDESANCSILSNDDGS